MTDTTTTTDAQVYAPEGMAWVDTYQDYPGHWEPVEDAGARDGTPQRVRYAEEDTVGGGFIVTVPADEPATLAEVMAVAADVERLRQQRAELLTALSAVRSALSHVLGR